MGKMILNGCSYIGGGGVDYSTTEQDTGLKWIDGKEIYQCTIDVGFLTNNSTKSVAHGISNIDNIIKIEGIAIVSSGSNFVPLPSPSKSAAYSVGVKVDKTNVSVETGQNRTTWYAYITLKYTKTT